MDKNALQSLRLVSKTLRALVISENPLVETTNYQLSVLILLPQLERLDKDPVSPEARTEAQERIKVNKRHTLFISVPGQTETVPYLVVLTTCMSFQELKDLPSS